MAGSEMAGVGCGAAVAGKGGLAMAGDGDGRMECGVAERESNAYCSMSTPDRSEKLAAARKKKERDVRSNQTQPRILTQMEPICVQTMKEATEQAKAKNYYNIGMLYIWVPL